MPELCRFLGITIQMYFDDHNPPHFHAYYNNNEAILTLDGKIIRGSFPKKQLDYLPSNVREICARNSTFAALTFEDFDAMLTASVNINNYKRAETVSPIEKIIKI